MKRALLAVAAGVLVLTPILVLAEATNDRAPSMGSTQAAGVTASGACATNPEGDVVCYDHNGAAGGQRTDTTDPESFKIRPQVCWAGDASCAASNVVICHGQDTTTIDIDAFGSCAGDNVHVIVTDGNGVSVDNTLTEGGGGQWTASGSNATTATSLAAAIDALPGVSATASSATVRIALDANTCMVALTESDGACTTVSVGSPGYALFPMGQSGGFTIGPHIGTTTNKFSIRPGLTDISFTLGPASTTTIPISISRTEFTTNAGSTGYAGVNSTDGIIYGGSATFTLTAGTFTGNTQGYLRATWYKLDWTNAMLAACGAGATCDLTVVTLPAKTRVERALLVVATAATHASTLTMSIGTAAGGTQYVLAGDIKAAANTVYGDAQNGAETGASLFSATDKWLDHIPSWTATQAINARITAGAGNVNSVTTSTGSVYLLLERIP